MKYCLGVMFGGESVEHEISIITANQAINAFDKNKYEIVPLYIAKNRQIYYGELLFDLANYSDLDGIIAKSKQVTLVKEGNQVRVIGVKGPLHKTYASIDIIVPIVHGTNCEDGTVAGFCEMLKVPYVGCSVAGAAVGQDKVFMRQILSHSGLPLVDWLWFYGKEYSSNGSRIIDAIEKKLKYPLIIKPANLGSSVGIGFANNRKQLEEAIELACTFDRKFIAEKVITDLTEVNCSVLGSAGDCVASVVEEVAKSADFLTYQEKYEGKDKTKGMVNTARIIPARLSDDDTVTVRDLARQTFTALDCSGVARIDFLMDNRTGKFYVNEINTIPGSLSFYLWQASDVDFPSLLDKLINIALENYKQKELLTYSYSTNVLKNFRGTKGAKKL